MSRYDQPIPYASAEWTEIVPGLYQGGHVYEVLGNRFRTKLKGRRDFQHVVSLYHEPLDPDTLPDADIPHSVFEMWDSSDALDPATVERLHELAEEISESMDLGHKVLVRCQAGYNRSGLLVTMVLRKRGWSTREAIAHLRRQRSDFVLCNMAFELFLLSLDPA